MNYLLHTTGANSERKWHAYFKLTQAYGYQEESNSFLTAGDHISRYISSRTEPCFVEWSRELRVITSGNLSAAEDNTSIVHSPSVPISLVTTGSVYY